jgi:hypothetical protein
MHDFRFAVRTLRRKPLFTLLVVVTLALGIGANTTIFSLLHQTLLRPLPYAEAERLVRMRKPGGPAVACQTCPMPPSPMRDVTS